METLRLRRIQEPSRIEALLHAYVSRTSTVPSDAYQMRDPSSLPKTLRGLVARAVERGQAWTCWARGSHLWLYTCEMSLPLSRERGSPVLLVRQYDEEAELKDSGTWRYDALGAWSRCAD